MPQGKREQKTVCFIRETTEPKVKARQTKSFILFILTWCHCLFFSTKANFTIVMSVNLSERLKACFCFQKDYNENQRFWRFPVLQDFLHLIN